MTPKVWYASKTLWFNILTGLVFLATVFFGYSPSANVITFLQTVVTNPLFIVAVNFVLRLVTNQPVTITPANV